MAFGQQVLNIPGITWRGARDPATAELAVRVDASWVNALKQTQIREWWAPLMMTVPGDASTEATRLPIDFEDLGAWQEDEGPRVARGVKPLQSVLIPNKGWKKERHIPTRDLKRNGFAGWPDRLTNLMLSARRMVGVIVRDMIFQAATTVKTYQGIPLVSPSGHLTDPTDPGSDTFGNLHTSTNFDIPGYELARDTVTGRLGPGGVPLDLELTYVLGGSKMRKKFDRMFKRILVLEDSNSGPAAAATTNIHYEAVEGGVIGITSAWLDKHSWLLANAGKDQWWTISTTLPARPFGVLLENGGAPTVNILDIGSEEEIKEDHILIKGKMGANGAGAFPHTIDEWRGT
jgi:hypothetical protein